MSNSILTINMITREAVMLFKNTNAFIQNIDKQYDPSFGKDGAKIGDTLRIRLPNDYTVADGPALSAQDTAEQSTTITVATQRHVDVSFSSADLALKIDDFRERVLAPMVNNLAANVAAEVMSGAEGGVANFVYKSDGSGGYSSPTADTILEAGANLDKLNSAPTMDRKFIADPYTMARTVGSLSGLFNPAPEISRQYRSGMMYDALNFRWMQDQTVIAHTSGTFSAGGTVNGADQTGLTVLVNAITGTLRKGDFVTFDGVYGVNRVTKQSTGMLRQFVVTANCPNGSTSIPIYPAIVPAAANGDAVQYQTVTASPANGAAMTLVNTASSQYRMNIAYAPQMITMVTADLPVNLAGAEASREVYDNVSMRLVRQYNIGTDQKPERLDVLFGYLFVRPEWGVVVADKIS